MNDLLDLAMPWWQFVLRGILAYIGLLIVLRLAGKRSFGEMSPFDIVVLILVGGALRSALVGKDTSLLGPMIAIASIVAVDTVLARLATWSPAFNRLLEGVPTLLARDGREIPGARSRHAIPEETFHRELRAHDVRSLADVEEATLEPNGKITVLKKRA